MRRILTIVGLWLAVAVGEAEAQAEAMPGTDAEREAVLAVLERLFDGMRARDSAAVRAVFHPAARLVATGSREGSPTVNVISADQFVAAVGSGSEVWDEPFWDPVVQVRDGLATVWTAYALYRDGEFSHCGVDAFVLARTTDGWRIVSIADTRQREGCEPPPDRR